MAVLPPRSSYALLEPYRPLMSSEDSVIKKFYPTSNFVEDMDGKRFAWQGVVKLPFIEEELLLSATKLHEKELGIDEVLRNVIKNDKILVMKSHSLASQICSIYNASGHILEKIEKKHCIDPSRGNLNGFLALCDDHTSMTEDRTISASFINPDYHVHKPVLLENVIEPEKTITEADIVERKLWHEYEGPNSQPSIRQQRYTPSTSSTDMFKSAGSGWGGRGRGKEPEMLPYTGCHARGGRRGCMTSERVSGRRYVTSETGYFGRQPDSYLSNGNQASRGSYSNFSNAVYHTRNSSFQESMNRSSDGSSNNWQWRSTEMATTDMNAVFLTRNAGFLPPMNRFLEGRSNNLQWRSTEMATSFTRGCGNHAAVDGRGRGINMMLNNHHTRGHGNLASLNGRGRWGRGNHAAVNGRGRGIDMMPNNSRWKSDPNRFNSISEHRNDW